ncbi:MAG: hypothetical protein GX079_01065, partial [Tissierellia bacterium]|nr:hypothetical protein [Tissierellia bacterium]
MEFRLLSLLLVVLLVFPSIIFADNGSTTSYFKKVNSFEDGGVYLIIGESSQGTGNKYALVNNNSTNSSYLNADSITITGDSVPASDVSGSMRWTAEIDNQLVYLSNNGGYLRRVSGSENLNAGGTSMDAGTNGWNFSSEDKLYVYSSGSKKSYYLNYRSGNSKYFNVLESPNSKISFYKLFEGDPGTEDEAIGSIEVSGIVAPVAGTTPGDTAIVSGHASLDYVSWSPANNSFDYDTAYTVDVVLKPDPSYKFTAATNGTVNGNTATTSLNANGTLKVSYTFAKTGPPTGDFYKRVNSFEEG